MVSRRELLAGGVAGGLAVAPAVSHAIASAAPLTDAAAAELQEATREGQREISRNLETVAGNIAGLTQVADGPVPKLRVLMEQFLKANAKFPDFIDVGLGIFFAMYDWHIRHQQQLVVTRQLDGRYVMQFMFTVLILRHENESSYIGVPYDKV